MGKTLAKMGWILSATQKEKKRKKNELTFQFSRKWQSRPDEDDDGAQKTPKWECTYDVRIGRGLPIDRREYP